MPVTHQFVSAVAAGSTATDVLSTNWNADHWSTWTNSTAAFPETFATTGAGITSSNTSAVSTFASFIIPARALSSNRMLHLTAFGDYLVGSTAVANNWNVQVTLNSSRWIDSISTLAAVGAARQLVMVDVYVAALNSSGTWMLCGTLNVTTTNVAPFGVGRINLAGYSVNHSNVLFRSSATFTVTTGAASTLSIQFKWTGANSSLSFTHRSYFIEYI